MNISTESRNDPGTVFTAHLTAIQENADAWYNHPATRWVAVALLLSLMIFIVGHLSATRKASTKDTHRTTVECLLGSLMLGPFMALAVSYVLTTGPVDPLGHHDTSPKFLSAQPMITATTREDSGAMWVLNDSEAYQAVAESGDASLRPMPRDTNMLHAEKANQPLTMDTTTEEPTEFILTHRSGDQAGDELKSCVINPVSVDTAQHTVDFTVMCKTPESNERRSVTL